MRKVFKQKLIGSLGLALTRGHTTHNRISLTNCFHAIEMAYEALDTLQQTLDLILSYNDHFIITPTVKLETLSIRIQAVVLQMNLRYYPYKERITEAANATYEIIEYLFSEENLSDGGSMEVTFKLTNQLRELAEKLESIAGDVLDYINGAPPPTDSQAVSSSSSKDVVIDLDEDVKVIKERLTGGSLSRLQLLPIVVKWTIRSRLQVLPIVGTGGIGKTTLAKIVYNDALVMDNFDIRGWVPVSQDYSVASIALNLLASITGISAEADVEEHISTESFIRQHLKYKKYLIILDDVCSKKAWDDLHMLFPDENNGSRIIVTTRLHDVAAYVASSTSIHTMHLLDSHHSWNLLKQKVFADEDCPLELEDIGKDIVKSCGGLPLSIVLVAGLLSKIRTRDSWKKIAENGVNLETIISSSYAHLPDNSKPCFLYMSGFPEDYEIHVSELINLWIVEGFLKRSNKSKSLEEEAEKCLEDLVERSLILVTSKKFDGKIKRCSLHDIVRDFCVRQAAKEKVVVPVMDYLPTPILRSHFLPRVIKDHHSISATSYDLHLKDYVHSSHIRTIICIPKKGYRPVGSIEKFNSLRVLHVLRRRGHCNWNPGQVFNLIHLTYLASNIPTSIVPSAISKLHNLKTLIIYRSEVRLPVEIWSLRQLRHLIANSFDALPYPEVEALPLENLETLSLATDFVCSERMVKMIPNIKTLGLRICYPKDERFRINNLKRLCQLEKLKLEMLAYLAFLPALDPIFPLSLQKLTLSGCEIPSSEMTIIGSLPNLQVLKLRHYAGRGTSWETTEGEFGELRVLLLECSGLVDWITKSSHFPRLERLIFRRYCSLGEIPSDIGHIPTLKLIEVNDMLGALLTSAKLLQEKRRNTGDDSFEIRVNGSG